MILPSTLLVFTFGILPVGFALYVSLQKWRLKRGDFLGLANYVTAIGNLAYVAAFLLAIGAIAASVILFQRTLKDADQRGDRAWPLALPAAVHAAVVLAFGRWVIVLLPEVLSIADKIIGVEKTRELFAQLLGEAVRVESVVSAGNTFLALMFAALVSGWLASRFAPSSNQLVDQAKLALAWLAAAIGAILLVFTYSEIGAAYETASETGTDAGIWPHVILILSGVAMLVLAWISWRAAERSESNRGFWLRIVGSMILLTGGWVLIGELPVAIAAGDKDLWSGLKVTIFYSIGTVPFQLSISLFLAILLFQKLRGSELFRMLYFLTYVTPTVASAAVFRQLFSSRPSALVNQVFRFVGLESQRWLQDSRGIFSILLQDRLPNFPQWASGPSLALVVIMIFSIWVYVGYDTVIYLAGLGNISTELIDAAQIDGAGRWQVFRHIIFPLLSPTTYFLSLLAIIGTFKAFQHIWVLRHEFALGTTDTFSVSIFVEFFEKVRYGYASALAFVLFGVILSLTYLNNKIQGSRVFYG